MIVYTEHTLKAQTLTIAEQQRVKVYKQKGMYSPSFYAAFGILRFGTKAFGTAVEHVDSAYIQALAPVGNPPVISTYLLVNRALTQTLGAP